MTETDDYRLITQCQGKLPVACHIGGSGGMGLLALTQRGGSCPLAAG